MDQLHNKFVQDLLEGSKLFPDNPYSLLPTVIFLVTTFVLIYRQFHKNTYNSTSLKSKLCKVSKRPEKVVLVLYCDLVFIGFDFSMDLLLHHKDLVHIFESLQMDGAFFRKFFIGNFSVLQRLESYIMLIGVKLQKNSSAAEIYYNQLITRLCMLVLVLTTALVPCLVFYLQHIYRRDIPNFLLW